MLTLLFASAATALSGATFEKDVRPVLSGTCSTCHNDTLASGGLSVSALLDPSSIATKREQWERILAKLRAGEMPPAGVSRPAGLDALIGYIQTEIDRADRNTKPNPGRVVAHRLNRAEYENTIRDLLGVDIRSNEEFPPDDSGYGFDNIGDVLTVSPALMQKYVSLAERIAARAVGGDPLPKPALLSRRDRARRLSASSIQLTQILEYDADYIVRANLVGHRGADDKPVTLVISVDGKPVKTASLPVQINAVNQQGGGTQRASEEVRVFLPNNEHTFRAEFVNDTALTEVPKNFWFNANRNIYPDSIEIAGPYPPFEPHPLHKTALMCDPASGTACVDLILSTLSRRAYRRSVTKAEVADLRRIFDKAKDSGYTPAQSLQFAISAMLVSPNFLFHIEHDPKSGSARISDIELASRLSYFLWNSMPDDELLNLGEKNQLRAPGVLERQVRRMIADPKASAFAENFAGQWLETRSLDAIKPDAKKFPEWGPDLRDAMRTETRMFFEFVLREDRPISDFIDGKYTFVNELLAKHYGIPGITGNQFRRIELDTDQRSGVFTQASVLTVSSYPSRTSVVLRGKYLLENVLNSPPPPPPPDVPKLNEEAVGVAQPLRQQMEQHRSDSVCASCHSKMDALGFALENYDATGKWRTQDGKFPIDASGTLPDGRKFSGPAELKALLKENMPEFTRCLAEKMLTYSLGRGLETSDQQAVNGLVSRTIQHDYKFQALIMGIVTSAPFQERAGERKR